MLTNVIDAVVTALQEAELSAGSAWPKAALQRGECFVAVGVERAEDCAGGFARYLGVETDAETGEHEVYGLRCEIELRLDIYAPLSEDNAAETCLGLFDTAAETISALPGLQVKGLSCGSPAPDRETGMFRLRGGVNCSALLLSTEQGEDGSFTDFVLRGELQQ